MIMLQYFILTLPGAILHDLSSLGKLINKLYKVNVNLLTTESSLFFLCNNNRVVLNHEAYDKQWQMCNNATLMIMFSYLSQTAPRTGNSTMHFLSVHSQQQQQHNNLYTYLLSFISCTFASSQELLTPFNTYDDKDLVCLSMTCLKQYVLPDIGSLAMQRMLGRGMTINCCNVS